MLTLEEEKIILLLKENISLMKDCTEILPVGRNTTVGICSIERRLTKYFLICSYSNKVVLDGSKLKEVFSDTGFDSSVKRYSIYRM